MAESSFTFPFSDLYAEVGEYAGLGRSPTGDNLALVKRRVNSGYRSFLGAHDWNFLKQTAVLTTQSGVWYYDLPDDFSQLVVPFKYPTDSSWINPKEVSEEEVLGLRTGSGTSTGRPYVFAIRPKDYSEGEGTRWEVLFHYPANGIYELIYSYKILVDELVNDADIPIGGAEHANTLRTFCLAEVELFDEEKGASFTTRLPADLAASIEKDKRKAPRSVGIMGETPIGYERREQTITINSVDVN